MRRASFALAATAAALPLVLTASAVPASAATGSLTVTAVGRHGTKGPANVYAYNEATESWYYLRAGRTSSVPRGRYVVFADVQDSDGPLGTDTLVTKAVKVSGRAALTLDARPGVAVRVAVDGVTGAGDPDARVDANVCIHGTPGLSAFNLPGKLYVVPTSLKEVNYAYIGDIRKGGRSYVLSGFNRAGVPTRPGGSFRSSSLARLTVAVRGNEFQSTQDLTEVRTDNQDGTEPPLCQFSMGRQVRDGRAPYAAGVWVSPGTWRVEQHVGASGSSYEETETSGDVRLAAGRAASVTFNRAVFSPNERYPEVIGHSLRFTPVALIRPGSGVGSGPWRRATVRTTVRLTKGGKLVKQAVSTSGAVFKAGLPSAGWYHLAVDARRFSATGVLPKGLLSGRVLLDVGFYARPGRTQAVPAFYTAFSPSGLNLANHAAARSVTTVRMNAVQDQAPEHTAANLKKVKSLKLWASYNGGRTWHAVTVTRSGSRWTAKVHNPVSGAVSLRSQVRDYSGDVTTETVYAAYGIG